MEFDKYHGRELQQPELEVLSEKKENHESRAIIMVVEEIG